jgi:hypothetical protein
MKGVVLTWAARLRRKQTGFKYSRVAYWRTGVLAYWRTGVLAYWQEWVELASFDSN